MSTAWTSRALRLLAFLVPPAAALWLAELTDPQLDEWVHVGQVELLLGGAPAVHERLTVFPGLHTIVAGVSSLGVEPLRAGRWVSLVFALVMLGAGLGLARRIVPERADLRVLTLALFPLAAPLGAVFYTDIPGLALLLLAVLAAHASAPKRGGLALTLMLALRHSLAPFVPFAFVLGFREGDDARAWLARSWPLLLPLGMLAAVLALGGGVALGDTGRHPVGLYAANLPFAAVLALVLFLPTHVRAAPAVWALVRRRPNLCVVSVTVGLALALLADPSHPFNDPSLDRLLYVRWIDLLFRTSGGRAILALACAYVPLSFATWRWRIDRFAWLAPFAIARLAMSWLVEPRYALPYLALVLLARPQEPRWMEGLYALAYAAMSFYLLDGMAQELWFPL